MVASNFGREETVAALLRHLQRGSDETVVGAVKEVDNHLCNCIHYAAGKGHAQVLSQLVEVLPEGCTRTEIVQAIDGGANTPLHKAAAGGHFSAAEYLIQSGFKNAGKNCDGMRPRDMANFNHHESIIKLLDSAAEGAASLGGAQKS